jgi:predicted nucleic acid-binding protein
VSALVCDAGILFKLLVAEPDTPLAFALAESHQINVPELAFAEVGDGLWARVDSGVSRADDVVDLLVMLNGYDFKVHSIRRHIESALSIANSLDHPIHDCLYLALAESLKVPLVSADARFLDALRRAGYRSIEIKALAEFA